MFEEPLLFQSTEQAEVFIVCNVQLDSHYGTVTSTSTLNKELLSSSKDMLLEYRMNVIMWKSWGIKSWKDCYTDKAILYSDFCPVL